jgi:hypothetical protein
MVKYNDYRSDLLRFHIKPTYIFIIKRIEISKNDKENIKNKFRL